MAISAFLIVGSAFRYDVSILLPDSFRNVVRLSVISFKNVLATVCTIIVAVGLWFTVKQDVNKIFAFLPLSIFFAGISLVLTANLNYKKMYKSMAICTFIQTVSTLAFNILFFKFSLSSYSGMELVISSILGQFARMVLELYFLKIRLREILFAIRQRYSRRIAGRYFDFAVYSLPASFITSLQTGLPVYALGFLHTAESVGQYALANRVLMVPLAIVGAGLSQVLLKYFSEKNNLGENLLGAICWIWGVSLIAVSVPAAFIFLNGEALTILVFGPQWVEAGQLISFLIIPVLVNFCLNITSSSHVVMRMQDVALYFSIAMLIAKILITFKIPEDYFMLLLSFSLVDLASIVLINVLLFLRLKKS